LQSRPAYEPPERCWTQAQTNPVQEAFRAFQCQSGHASITVNPEPLTHPRAWPSRASSYGHKQSRTLRPASGLGGLRGKPTPSSPRKPYVPFHENRCGGRIGNSLGFLRGICGGEVFSVQMSDTALHPYVEKVRDFAYPRCRSRAESVTTESNAPSSHTKFVAVPRATTQGRSPVSAKRSSAAGVSSQMATQLAPAGLKGLVH